MKLWRYMKKLLCKIIGHKMGDWWKQKSGESVRFCLRCNKHYESKQEV